MDRTKGWGVHTGGEAVPGVQAEDLDRICVSVWDLLFLSPVTWCSGSVGLWFLPSANEEAESLRSLSNTPATFDSTEPLVNSVYQKFSFQVWENDTGS